VSESGPRMRSANPSFDSLDKASSAIRLRGVVTRVDAGQRVCSLGKLKHVPFRLHAESSWQMVIED